MLGKVKSFNPRRGYGFIETRSKGQYFVFYSDIVMNGYKKLHPGQTVRFVGETVDANLQARKVKPI